MTNNFTGLKWVDAPNLVFENNMKAKGAFKKGKFTREGIKDYLTLMSKDAKKKRKTGQFAVSIHYSDINKWKAGKSFPIGDDASVFNPYDELFNDDHIDGLQIYYLPTNDAKHLSGTQKSMFV
jgi:hypothetical protein